MIEKLERFKASWIDNENIKDVHFLEKEDSLEITVELFSNGILPDRFPISFLGFPINFSKSSSVGLKNWIEGPPTWAGSYWLMIEDKNGDCARNLAHVKIFQDKADIDGALLKKVLDKEITSEEYNKELFVARIIIPTMYHRDDKIQYRSISSAMKDFWYGVWHQKIIEPEVISR